MENGTVKKINAYVDTGKPNYSIIGYKKLSNEFY